MSLYCPYCSIDPSPEPERPKVIRAGRFRRKSDARFIQRYRCLRCVRSFSRATFHPCYRQNKRHFNEKLRRHLSSGLSQRRAARLFHLSRTTVVRKFRFLAQQARLELQTMNEARPLATVVEFDDMETFEHTKCKPLAISLAVESGTRRVLGFAVARMPAKGPLAKIALKKYGPRPDQRTQARAKLFTCLKPLVAERAVIKSDQNPHYLADIKRHFPKCEHMAFKSRRAAVVGQGELKKIGFDPIFSFNHTAAKFRADMNRLFRKTWCTTKKPERLADHLAIYAVYHNQTLPK